MLASWQLFTEATVISAFAAGFYVTVTLTLASMAGALFLGSAITVCRVADPSGIVARIADAYVDIVRNIPLLIALFLIYFGSLNLLPAHQYPFMRSPFLPVIVIVGTIAVVQGGSVAEVIRGGLESIPRGQMEAALACGLNARRTYRLVIVPQLIPRILPGISNEMINVLKGTTYAMTIGVADLMWQAQRLESQTFRGIEIMTGVSILYLLISGGIVFVGHLLERACKIPGTKA